LLDQSCKRRARSRTGPAAQQLPAGTLPKPGIPNIARLSLGNFTLTGWMMTSAPTDGGSLTATWLSNEPSFAAMGQDGQKYRPAIYQLAAVAG
jgi:hypothetical protein